MILLRLKHLGDCDSEGLRGYLCDSTIRPIAKIPCDVDGFCLAGPLVVVQITLRSACRMRLGIRL